MKTSDITNTGVITNGISKSMIFISIVFFGIAILITRLRYVMTADAATIPCQKSLKAKNNRVLKYCLNSTKYVLTFHLIALIVGKIDLILFREILLNSSILSIRSYCMPNPKAFYYCSFYHVSYLIC